MKYELIIRNYYSLFT